MTLFPEGWAQARPPTASLSLITAGNAAAWSSAKQSTFRPSFFHVRVLSLGVFLIASTFETQVTVVCTCVHVCVLIHKLVCVAYMCVCTCMCARVCPHTNAYVMCVCVPAHVLVCVCSHTNMFVSYVCACVCAHVCSHTNMCAVHVCACLCMCSRA